MKKTKKKNLRKILAALEPSEKGVLVAEQLKEDTNDQLKAVIQNFNNKVENLKSELLSEFEKLPDFSYKIPLLEKELNDKIDKLGVKVKEDIANVKNQIKKPSDTLLKGELDIKLSDIRKEFITRIGNIRGGNMNRNILVGNNPSTLGRYTDLNILAGNNVTLTYTNNDNLKTTNLTIAATGGSGVTRNISTVIVSSVIAAVAATDYVIIANAGIQLTLPTAVGNQNLYTIKNVGTSSVLVGTTGGQTIDGDTTITMPLRYTAVDLVSDDANWNVT